MSRPHGQLAVACGAEVDQPKSRAGGVRGEDGCEGRQGGVRSVEQGLWKAALAELAEVWVRVRVRSCMRRLRVNGQ